VANYSPGTAYETARTSWYTLRHRAAMRNDPRERLAQKYDAGASVFTRNSARLASLKERVNDLHLDEQRREELRNELLACQYATAADLVDDAYVTEEDQQNCVRKFTHALNEALSHIWRVCGACGRRDPLGRGWCKLDLGPLAAALGGRAEVPAKELHDEAYRLLGVTTDATPVQLRRAFLALARKLHPDKRPGCPTATDDFQTLQLTYQGLLDPETRARYDRTGRFEELEDEPDDSTLRAQAELARTPYLWLALDAAALDRYNTRRERSFSVVDEVGAEFKVCVADFDNVSHILGVPFHVADVSNGKIWLCPHCKRPSLLLGSRSWDTARAAGKHRRHEAPPDCYASADFGRLRVMARGANGVTREFDFGRLNLLERLTVAAARAYTVVVKAVSVYNKQESANRRRTRVGSICFAHMVCGPQGASEVKGDGGAGPWSAEERYGWRAVEMALHGVVPYLVGPDGAVSRMEALMLQKDFFTLRPDCVFNQAVPGARN